MLSVFDQGPPAPCPTPFNLAAYVLGGAERNPDKICMSVIGATTQDDMRFADLKSAVLGIATGLRDRGLKPGQRVLLRLGNTPAFPLTFLGCIAAGLIPIASSAQLTEPEVAGILAELSPALTIRDPSVSCPAHAAMLDVGDLMAMTQLSASPYDLGDPNRPAYMIYTSGSSGRPRPVLHAHRAIWARRMMFDHWYGLGPDDRMLHAGAFNWTYTLGTGLLDPWTMGATALIPATGTDSRDLPDLMAKHRATIFAAAPGVYRQLLKAETLPPLPDLRHGLSAGEKLSPAMHHQWTARTGKPLFEAYGMSECSTFISASPRAPTAPELLGRPQPGRRIAIIGPDGPVPSGEAGEIAIHKDEPGLMLRYDGNDPGPGRRQGDWFLTGDIGVMDDTGAIRFEGRNDDMMNAGGFRVSPAEVEHALAQHPAIEQIAVTEVAVKTDVTVIAAFYTAPRAVDESDLKAFAAARLARYKQPRLYHHLAQLPVGPNGKLRRKALSATLKDAQ